MRIPILAAVIAAWSAGALVAQGPSITVDEVPCFPERDNGIVWATVEPEVGGSTVRLYFRWDEHGDMYFVDMIAGGDGRYWGIPAKPERRTEEVELFVAVVDPSGRVLSRTDELYSPVEDDCDVELTPVQAGVANNLTVGETVPAQEGNKILGFLCDGVVTRISSDGILRPDEVCRACVIAWWLKEEYIAPILAIPPATFICCVDGGGDEVSPIEP